MNDAFTSARRPRPAPRPDGAPEASTRALRGLHLHLEPVGGMAGDMFLGAMIDLGVPEETVAAAVAALELRGLTIETRGASRGGIAGLRFRTLLGGRPLEGPEPGDEPEGEVGSSRPPSRPEGGLRPLSLDLEEVREILASSPLDETVQRRADRMFGRVASALARNEGMEIEEVRFAGPSGVDFFADLVGAAAAIEWLKPRTVSCGPVQVGGAAGAGGPGPGTVWLLDDAPLAPSTGGERLTPTGAAILSELVQRFGPAPRMEIDAVGVGLGRAETADRPNMVEATLGRVRDSDGTIRRPRPVPSPGGTSA